MLCYAMLRYATLGASSPSAAAASPAPGATACASFSSFSFLFFLRALRPCTVSACACRSSSVGGGRSTARCAARARVSSSHLHITRGVKVTCEQQAQHTARGEGARKGQKDTTREGASRGGRVRTCSSSVGAHRPMFTCTKSGSQRLMPIA